MQRNHVLIIAAAILLAGFMVAGAIYSKAQAERYALQGGFTMVFDHKTGALWQTESVWDPLPPDSSADSDVFRQRLSQQDSTLLFARWKPFILPVGQDSL